LVAVGILALGGPQVASGTSPFTARQVAASRTQTSWSPDGRWIAFAYEDPVGCCGGPVMTLFSADGSAQRVLGNDLPAVWSQDGRRIGWLDSERGGLTVADVDSGAVRPTDLSVMSFGTYEHWDWSPDGAHVAYVTPGGSLRVAAWDGSGVRELASSANFPQWSPDGREIAFSSGGTACWSGSAAVELIESDGTNHRVLAMPGELRLHPGWSPQGDRIAFGAGLGCRAHSRVYIARRDGSGEHVVDVVPWDPPGTTAWSPDGRWLAPSFFELTYSLIEADGPGRVPSVEGPAVWAPSSDRVVFSNRFATTPSVTVMSLDGSERTVARGRAPDWSPDGTRISFVAPAYESFTVFGHCEEQVFVIGVGGNGKRPISPCWQDGSNWTQMRDVLFGTQAQDTARAYSGPDVVSGLGGDDRLFGGDGPDRIFGGPGSDTIFAGRGNDRVGVRDGERDRITCGKGRDIVLADSLDVAAGDCESVRRG
jgi:Tol biopolymer transport system component